MLMWKVIFMSAVWLTLLSFLYVGVGVSRFAFVKKVAKGGRIRGLLCGFALASAVFSLLWLVLDLVNAIICLLHFAMFWVLCDAIFGVAKLLRRESFKRYYAGVAVVLLSVICLGAGWYLDNNVWISHYTVNTDKNVRDFRVVMFADSHIGATFEGKDLAKYVRLMQAENPDVVLIVGDFVDDGTNRQNMIDACAALRELKAKYGVYFVFGNHDKGYYDNAKRGFTAKDLVAELQKNGVTVLQDEFVLTEGGFYIVGRNDASEVQRGGSRAGMQALVKPLDKGKYAVVMDHQPNDYENQAKTEVDLVVSGHTHGGQLFPLNKVGEWIGANDKTYGYERRGKTDFIVTSGISDWAIKFKTGTKSEIVVIDVKGM